MFAGSLHHLQNFSSILTCLCSDAWETAKLEGPIFTTWFDTLTSPGWRIPPVDYHISFQCPVLDPTLVINLYLKDNLIKSPPDMSMRSPHLQVSCPQPRESVAVPWGPFPPSRLPCTTHTQSWAWLLADLVSPSPDCSGDSYLHGSSSEHPVQYSAGLYQLCLCCQMHQITLSEEKQMWFWGQCAPGMAPRRQQGSGCSPSQSLPADWVPTSSPPCSPAGF